MKAILKLKSRWETNYQCIRSMCIEHIAYSSWHDLVHEPINDIWFTWLPQFPELNYTMVQCKLTFLAWWALSNYLDTVITCSSGKWRSSWNSKLLPYTILITLYAYTYVERAQKKSRNQTMRTSIVSPEVVKMNMSGHNARRVLLTLQRIKLQCRYKRLCS